MRLIKSPSRDVAHYTDENRRDVIDASYKVTESPSPSRDVAHYTDENRRDVIDAS